MAYIIPGILTTEVEDLLAKVDLIKDHTQMIHIDFMDGIYVKSTSLSLVAMSLALKNFNFLNKVEIHMMAIDPLNYIENIAAIKNIDSVVIHKDSCENIVETVEAYKKRGIKVGLSVSIKDKNLDSSYIPMDYFLVLAAEEPGFSGTSFNADGVRQIKQIKEEYKGKSITADGGINEITGKVCINAGANKLISNSYIFKSSNPLEALHTLEQI